MDGVVKFRCKLECVSSGLALIELLLWYIPQEDSELVLLTSLFNGVNIAPLLMSK